MTTVSVVRDVLPWLVHACFAYLALTYALFLLHLLAAAVENVRRGREGRVEDYGTLSASRFTIPVSVIMPCYNEGAMVVAAVRSVLESDYPEHEVIVVNDGSKDDTLAQLVREFDLLPREVFFRRVLASSEVQKVYRSARDPRLVVVDKVNGGKADALNAGINLARYRYLCCVDGDTVYEKDALLRGMRLAVSDPATVVGVTSMLAIGTHPEARGADGRRPMDTSLLSNFQHFDYLRSFLNTRSAWSRHDFMLCAIGAFMIWRRDLVVEMGGFSRDFTCEDIEFTFRVYERFRREGRACRILSLPDTIGVTEGPDRISSLVSQRARWQRVIVETVWHYRRMLGRPRYGAVGLIGMPFYVLAECLAPFFELLSALTLVAALAFALFSPLEFALFTGTIAFANASFTVAALLGQDRLDPRLRRRDLLRLALIAPLELIAYRPWLVWARIKGTIDLLRGDKRWHKFERNQRRPAAVPAAAPALAPARAEEAA